MDMLQTKVGAGIAVLLSLLLYLHRRLLPKPIPGIPYNQTAAKRILGDIPDALKWNKSTGEIWSFIRQRSAELRSPIFQVFMRSPLGRPWVVITDFREAQDIQTFRQGEFDRSAFLGDVFGPLLPGNQVWMPSDERFHSNRSLLRDTMSPPFLHGVVAPAIHDTISDLLNLWQQKARLAQGRPFQADRDIVRSVVDLILLASLGTQTELSKTQAALLSGLDQVSLPSDIDAPAVFPSAEESPTYTAIRTLVDSIQIGMKSPAPKIHMTFALRFYPSLVAAKKYTDAVMTSVLQAAWTKFYNVEGEKDDVKSAADLLVRREAQMARKQNRSVMQNSLAIRDELFGFYLAGHESTSTTLCWAVKHLTAHQGIQRKLRTALRSAHKTATAEQRLPTAQEIVETSVPYLDAFIEENHRLGNAIPATIRRTTRDACVLGHTIPKGTDVFMMSNGPGFQSPGFAVEESKRSRTSQETKDRCGVWDEKDIEFFKPERFLVDDGKGGVRFDAHAGPVLAYGAGLRGCFGIKLAILELRVIITMIVWAFELRETPAELSSFKAHDVNTHRAEQTYLRLAEWMGPS